jgi:hypothetical protein
MPTPELDLLRLIVREDAPAIRPALADSDTGFAAFLGFAHQHQLGAFVYWKLQRLGLTRLLSTSMLAAVKAAWLVEQATSMKLALQLRDLVDILDKGNASVLFIKGPLFAQRFYGSVDARSIADLDVLIQAPEQLADVEALLLEAGFEPAFRVLLSRRLSHLFAHHFEYRRNSLGLDVHWKLQSHVTFAIDYARIWSTATRVDLDDRTYPCTSDEYELVLQILGGLTDMEVGKLTLRSRVDIYHVLQHVHDNLDWDGFFASRRSERILRPSAFILMVVLDVLDCHDRFPALAARLEPMRRVLPKTTHVLDAVLHSRPLDIRQKLLALRIYETPLAVSISWWLLSLPFRLAVYGLTRRPLRMNAPSAWRA